jgi:hypothetical protein
MSDPVTATETQLRNIESRTGTTLDGFADAVAARGTLTHGQVIALLKSEYGLTHGNANLIAHKVREMLAGGPTPSEDLLEAQYRGGKAALRPIYERLAAIAAGLGPDVAIVIQKTGVSLRRRRQFAVVQAPSAQRIQLGLNLVSTPDDARVTETAGMCSHRVDLRTVDQVDDDVARWMSEAYDAAG